MQRSGPTVNTVLHLTALCLAASAPSDGHPGYASQTPSGHAQAPSLRVDMGQAATAAIRLARGAHLVLPVGVQAYPIEGARC